MVRSTLATAASLVLTTTVVTHAYYLKRQFYPTVVYLTKSSPSMAVLYIQAFVLVFLIGKFMRKVFFGQLRAAEMEHLIERSWYAVTETCLAFTVFRDDFSPRFVALFTLLLFLKCFHWLAEDRVDFMERSPNISWLFHFRVVSLTSLLALLDLLFVNHACHSIMTRGASVQLVFGFEYAILLTMVLTIFIKYILHTIDLQSENPWDNKAVYMLYTELLTGFIKVLLYMAFMTIMIKVHTFPLFAIRPMYLTMRQFKKAVTDAIMSRRAIRNMNTLYPDASPEELQQTDNVCIICREEMVTGAKRLPCNHIFHTSCLRSWFQRQQTCPTCRMDVLRVTPPMQTPPQQPQPQVPQTPLVPQQPNLPPGMPPFLPGMFPFWPPMGQHLFPQAPGAAPNAPQPNTSAATGAEGQTNKGHSIHCDIANEPAQCREIAEEEGAWEGVTCSPITSDLLMESRKSAQRQSRRREKVVTKLRSYSELQCCAANGEESRSTEAMSGTGLEPPPAGSIPGFPFSFPAFPSAPWVGMPPPPFGMPPMPMPPSGFAGLTDEELRAMEGQERQNLEARLQCLQNIHTLLDAAMVQIHQYLSVVATLSPPRPTATTSSAPSTESTDPASGSQVDSTGDSPPPAFDSTSAQPPLQPEDIGQSDLEGAVGYSVPDSAEIQGDEKDTLSEPDAAELRRRRLRKLDLPSTHH